MKKYLIVLSLLALSACGGGKSHADDPPQQNGSQGTLIETGFCSDNFLDRFNQADQLLRNFRTYKLRGAGYLIQAYESFDSILYDYGKISCFAKDRENGTSTHVTKNYVAQYRQSALSLLSNESENCKYPSYPKDDDESSGCNIILNYMASLKK